MLVNANTAQGKATPGRIDPVNSSSSYNLTLT
ncbi:hypothetical protein FB468_0608 [Leucobacter komagatae]|uniref:Uncharacterized protein n=1 Tax=Leucobacter komagatae TaxID=55969 RepID=A0A542Y3F2_9MICO|nr:hypothetical protein FB468_0608 [Leucobacter komagatae]